MGYQNMGGEQKYQSKVADLMANLSVKTLQEHKVDET